ncbi:MAG: LacI family DNA-binding transcriptional regulator [Chloroflexota bacterium]
MSSIIERIAKEMSVSNASVSRALNDRPGVGAELRERILQKARELKYTPSITARGLVKSQSFGIGFFVREKPGISTHSDPFYGEILHGVEQALAHTDYHVTVATLTREILAEPLDFRFVRERRIDGMILAGPDISSDAIMTLLQSGIPLVLVDNQLAHSRVNCINSDDEGGAYLAAHHLLELGHRKIGALSGPEHWASNARRIAGYRRALAEHDLPLVIVYAELTTIESGEESYRRLTAKYPDLTAICAVNDAMALGAIRAAQANGKNIPADLSIIGFDDIPLASLNEPRLTTIRVPKRQMGTEAAQRVLALLGNAELSPVEVQVSVDLIQRSSTRALS